MTFFALAFFASYSLYAVVAAAVRTMSLGYNSFYAAFALISFALVLREWRVGEWRARQQVHWPSVSVLALAVILTSTYFQFPSLNDQGLFDSNILSSRMTRTFRPSADDVLPFGITSPQPRMSANLYHAFYAVASELARTDPRELTFVIANPFIGLFFFVTMTSVLWELSFRRVDPVFCLVAVVFAFALAFTSSNVYWYSFRFLNGPTLDKDFALFILLPALMICAFRGIVSEPDQTRRWFAWLLLGIPAAILSHPVTPVYFAISAGVISAALMNRRRWHRIAAVMTIAAGSYFVAAVAIETVVLRLGRPTPTP